MRKQLEKSADTRRHEGNLPIALRLDLKYCKVCLLISLWQLMLETFGKKH